MHCNATSSGFDLDTGFYTGSYASCAALCVSNPLCTVAEYKTASGLCYQKPRLDEDGFSSAQQVVTMVCQNNEYEVEESSGSVSFMGVAFLCVVGFLFWRFRVTARPTKQFVTDVKI